MTWPQISTIAVSIGGWLTATFVWFKWLHEVREKRLERAAKEKAEGDLRQIRRRGDAPYLEPSATFFTGINFIFEKDEHRLWQAGGPKILSFQRDEVSSELPPGQPIIFVVNNAGESARGVVVKLDGAAIALKMEADVNDSHGLYYLEYPYEPEKHGREQALVLSFETRSGVQDIHRYITRHGFRVLKRIDPALP
jgi:hypothetical protein